MGGIVFSDLKTTQDNFRLIPAWQRYGQSKLANILYASSLAKMYGDRGILSVSVHPGVFDTGLIKNLSWGNKAFVYLGNGGTVKDAAVEGQGASNTCWAATSPREGVLNGAFYMPVGELGKKERKGGNVKLEEELWAWTKKELEVWVDK
jgi:NAD(P)-dependent dehydrogenase (short-subunit alcohol dehydrogenase family)